jgi:hypothetical protein
MAAFMRDVCREFRGEVNLVAQGPAAHIKGKFQAGESHADAQQGL